MPLTGTGTGEGRAPSPPHLPGYSPAISGLLLRVERAMRKLLLVLKASVEVVQQQQQQRCSGCFTPLSHLSLTSALLPPGAATPTTAATRNWSRPAAAPKRPPTNTTSRKTESPAVRAGRGQSSEQGGTATHTRGAWLPTSPLDHPGLEITHSEVGGNTGKSARNKANKYLLNYGEV